jgi:WD40 repeat protein
LQRTNGTFCANYTSKALHIVDLENPAKEGLVIKSPSSQKTFEFGVAQWNQSSYEPSLLAAAVNTETYAWKVDPQGSRCDMVGKFQTHKRIVCDVGWNYGNPNLLATCAADNYVFIWDLRDTTKPMRFFKSFTGSLNRLIQ